MELEFVYPEETEFKKGDLVGYAGSPQRSMVVGESATHLHTFVLGSGDYWGVFKRKENLDCLLRFGWPNYLGQ